jgi:hypothetical protein
MGSPDADPDSAFAAMEKRWAEQSAESRARPSIYRVPQQAAQS